MRILGIETSCDETAVCIIEAEGDVTNLRFSILGNALSSQMQKHVVYGGVYPTLAKREHASNLVPVLEAALMEAILLIPAEKPEVNQEKIAEMRTLLEREPELAVHLMAFLARTARPPVDVIAVTYGPGLEPALWVGVNFARALALVWNLPIVAVNHMEGHVIISALMRDKEERSVVQCDLSSIQLPAVALLISGGHTELDLMPEWFVYERIGQTRDDAVGEAFDKVARLLGLPYPGGPQISRLAKEAREKNLPQPFKLPRPMRDSGDFDFSFSGVKTAVRVLIQKLGELSDETRMQLAREFEDSAADILVRKTLSAVEEYGALTVIVGGGVSANTYIRESLATALQNKYPSVQLLVPPPVHATDNGIMIALTGYFHAKRGEYTDPAILKAHGTKQLKRDPSAIAPFSALH